VLVGEQNNVQLWLYIHQERSSGTLGCFFWYLFLQRQEKYALPRTTRENRRKIARLAPRL
ncbi:MAG: hypothetical protein J5860_00810, partial [Clostridia bacterium]|nr:hypothetical protein [Clostridia bacterium]